MMKRKLLGLFFILCFDISLRASECRYVLYSENAFHSGLERIFDGFGLNRRQACSQAKLQCDVVACAYQIEDLNCYEVLADSPLKDHGRNSYSIEYLTDYGWAVKKNRSCNMEHVEPQPNPETNPIFVSFRCGSLTAQNRCAIPLSPSTYETYLRQASETELVLLGALEDSNCFERWELIGREVHVEQGCKGKFQFIFR
ncbi:MAG: hypothetical protein HRU19_19310 [Pseudobacteriovorax sp.]|nr:hypothetical protein [Pseudobacteriovorax sp.]